jgi:hypothetical protein
LHLLFDFEAQRRSTRVKLSDSQLCVRLTEKLYRGLSAATIRRKLQEARISRKLQDACIGAPTSILDLINTAFTSLEPSMSLPVERISNSRADFKLKLLHLLFDFEAQRRSTRVKLSDSQLCVRGHVAELVGIEGGVVSGVINLESSGA